MQHAYTVVCTQHGPTSLCLHFDTNCFDTKLMGRMGTLFVLHYFTQYLFYHKTALWKSENRQRPWLDTTRLHSAQVEQSIRTRGERFGIWTIKEICRLVAGKLLFPPDRQEESRQRKWNSVSATEVPLEESPLNPPAAQGDAAEESCASPGESSPLNKKGHQRTAH